MAGKPFKDGPAFVASSAADLYVPAANTYALVRHIHIANATTSAVTLGLYVGATGGSANGTEICELYSVAASDVADFFFPSGLRLEATDFLTGIASSASALACTITGELYVT